MMATTTATPPQRTGQVVLILVGLVGSGKSTFAEALETHFPIFRRCNQDDLGSRKNVEAAVVTALDQGYSVCVDRTNFDQSQREHFINIAQSFPDTQIWGLVFDTPYQTCIDRLRTRTGHPTITSPQQGLQILQRFASDYRPPILEEGFHRLYYMTPYHPTGEYSKEDIAAILHKISISEENSNNRRAQRFFRTNDTRPDAPSGWSICNTVPTSSRVPINEFQ